jgi:hypothetical protein
MVLERPGVSDYAGTNARELMDNLFSLLAEAEAAIQTGDEWLTPEEVDATLEV